MDFWICHWCAVQGEGLLRPCMDDRDEVTVLIGAERCNITVITDSLLQCKPPLHQPLGGASSPLPRVTVSFYTRSINIL